MEPLVGKPGVALLVWNLDEVGGMERQAARLATGLAAAGARALIVTTAPAPGPKAPPRREVRDGVVVLRVPRTWWLFGGAERVWAAAAATALRRHRGELAALYAVHAKTGAHTVAIGRALGLPVFVKLAGAGPRGDLASLAHEPEGPRLRSLLREADRILCLSAELEREAVDAGLPPGRLRRVKNGVDLGRFSPDGPRAELPELAGRTALVLAVGRLDPPKRYDDLIRAFSVLAAREPGARLAFAGEGPHQGELEELARALGLAGKAVFLGARSDVPELLRAASVFVLPSSGEGQSNALLEALASGVPVVATAIAANAEVVADGREGLLVPVGNVTALAVALGRVLEDSALAVRLGAAGRARALEYDPARVVDRHLELVREVVPETAGRRGRPRTGALLGLWASALAVAAASILRHAVRRACGLLAGAA